MTSSSLISGTSRFDLLLLPLFLICFLLLCNEDIISELKSRVKNTSLVIKKNGYLVLQPGQSS